MADEDEQALTWDGGSDPTHVDSPEPDAATASEAESAPGTSSAMLVVYGVLGGVYLLYTVGWFITAVRGSQATGIALNDIMSQVSGLLAVLAAPAWFIATLALTQSRRSWVRVVILVIGVLVLIPWGFVSGVRA